MRYPRSPPALLKESTGIPIFFPTAPLRKPRTEWGCHPVAFMRSFKVAPSGRRSRARILAVLLPLRAVVGFLARVALRAGLALDGATCARRLATRAFLARGAPLTVAIAGALVCSCGIEVVIWLFFPLTAMAVTTLIPPVGGTCK